MNDNLFVHALRSNGHVALYQLTDLLISYGQERNWKSQRLVVCDLGNNTIGETGQANQELYFLY